MRDARDLPRRGALKLEVTQMGARLTAYSTTKLTTDQGNGGGIGLPTF